MFLAISIILIIIMCYRHRCLPFQKKLMGKSQYKLKKDILNHGGKKNSKQLQKLTKIKTRQLKAKNRVNKLNSFKNRRRRLLFDEIQAVIFGIALIGSIIWIAPLIVDRLLTHNPIDLYLAVFLMLILIIAGIAFNSLKSYQQAKRLANHYKKQAKKVSITAHTLFIGTIGSVIKSSMKYELLLINVLMLIVSAALLVVSPDQESLIWIAAVWIVDVLHSID